MLGSTCAASASSGTGSNKDFERVCWIAWCAKKPSGKKKAHKHKLFCPVGLGTTPGLSRGFHWVCPWDKPGENLGQTRVFSLFLHSGSPDFTGFVPGTNPVCSAGQSRGRRAAQKVYLIKTVYVPFSLATPTMAHHQAHGYLCLATRHLNFRLCHRSLLAYTFSEVIQEPLPLKPGILVKKSVVLVKRKNGFTKTIPWAENPGKIRKRSFY